MENSSLKNRDMGSCESTSENDSGIGRKIFTGIVAVAAGAVFILTIVLNNGNEIQESDALGTSNEKSDVSNNGSEIEKDNALGIPSENAKEISETKVNDRGAVTVEVTPKLLGIDEEQTIFTVALNTHSVELDFEFDEIITLRDDLGNNYKALEWTGNSGWHHVNGDIIFSSIDSKAKEVKLLIKDVDDIDREFGWVL